MTEPAGVRCPQCGRYLGLPKPGGEWVCHGMVISVLPQRAEQVPMR